jgi:hypothetical protein
MWRLLALAAIATATAWGVADVRVFVTSSASGCGLDLLGPQGDGTGIDPEHEDWPIDPFRPTYSTVDSNGNTDYAWDYYYAYYRVAAYPPIDAPSGTADDPILIDASAGNWAYVWFQFRKEPYNKVNFIELRASPAGHPNDPTPDLEPTYYLQNDRWGYGKARWDGSATPPDYPEWHGNPQTMLANFFAGIQNLYDDPVLMFDNQRVDGSLRTGVALLGAFSGLASDTVYEYRITLFSYAWFPQPVIGESAFFKIVPEPRAIFLLAVAALRRRRGPPTWPAGMEAPG